MPTEVKFGNIQLDIDDLSVFSTGHFGASGNDFDSHGNLFQSSIAMNLVSKVTPSGDRNTFSNVGFSSPVGIAIDEDDNLYVCNCFNNTLRKVTPAGVSTEFSNSPMLSCPRRNYQLTMKEISTLLILTIPILLKLTPMAMHLF